MPHFEKRWNRENRAVEDVVDDYKVLTAPLLDDEGQPLPERVTGFDMIPAPERDILTAFPIAEVWRTTPEEQLDAIPASEFMRRLALVKAKTYSQPTPHQMRQNREKKRRMGR